MWNAISLVQDWTRVAMSISYNDNHYTMGTSELNTQHYKVQIKSMWSNPGNGVASPLHLCVVAIELETFGSSLTMIGQLNYIYIYKCVFVGLSLNIFNTNLDLHLFYDRYWALSFTNISLMSGVFANGLGDWGSILGRVIPKTQKMVLDAVLLNTQHYMVRIKGKVEQSREWSNAFPYTSVW